MVGSEHLGIVAAGIAAFVLFWIALVSLIGALSGWRALAAAYPVQEPFDGRWISIRRARLGLASYKGGSLRAGVDAMGLHLAPMALFRPGHAPLFVPWGEVRVEPPGDGPGRAVVFRFARAPNVILQLTESDGEAILRARAFGGLVPS